MKSTLTIRDNRTGRTYEIPVEGDAVAASDLHTIRVDDNAPGLLVFDPALRNTATCRSAITSQDGHAGVLAHRGYAIEELAEQSNYLETAYLVYHGELPSASELAKWQADIAEHYVVHQYVTRLLEGFRHDAHPMGVLISTVAALSTFYPNAKFVEDPAQRRRHAVQLIGQVPTLAAFAHRRRQGMPFAYPDTDLTYIGNFLNMMFRATELRYEPDPNIERALDVLFLLHTDHGQACSTTTMRCVGSALTDPYSACAAAAAALYGRFHGEGFGAVLDMFREIGSVDKIPAFLDRVAGERLEPPGFGHRLYRTYDPRARLLKQEAHRLFRHLPATRYFEIALALDDASQRHPYFQEAALFPIVDFYEAILYDAIGFPSELFPVLFALPRFVGWLAQWEEMIANPGQKTYRPQQIYIGPQLREYVPIDRR